MVLEQKVYTDGFEEVDLTINGQPWHLLQARVELTTADTPNFVDMVLTPTQKTSENLPPDPTLAKPDGLLGTEFVLEIDTELSVGARDKEKTKIFTGNLANLSSAGDGAWEGIAWDPSHQSFASGEGDGNSGNFLNTKISIPAASSNPSRQITQSSDLRGISYGQTSFDTAGATKIQTTELVERIIEQSPLDPSKVETNFAEKPGVKIGELPSGEEIYGGIDRELSFSNYEITVSSALERIENATNSTWWFDAEGVFHIGAPEPGNPIDAFDLQFIIETSAGKSTPAWQGVQVIGSGVVSEDGWDRSNMNSATPALSAASMADDGSLDTDKLAEPVFTYRNLEIQTQAEADSVAKEIINKLQKQQAEGKITVVGFPEVRPLDAVVMPDSELQPMGGTRYAVEKVIHNINPSDGFITDIHVGGLTRANRTTFTDEFEVSEVTNSVIASNTVEGLAQGDGI